ncbi:patatin-like phospholipase family protein [Amycolatopsis sp. DSM 110486]|uniref:patatin-like phospholipase family protein n=1 Tax=Amycolatopsis sp. DSM 110486 TaxID=2865832 RepID=UPI001C69D392|nr:patatin-like phospholipase family protein [Amycolatopsis sp. DSM 110486]QYN19294.1 patatin-like phospholipase family protein [Amycolatopsis sp. DSM 110486]
MPRTREILPLTALVLGGGGPVGAAWTSALVHRLETAGLPLSESGVVVGTSAGSVVGAWLTMDPAGLTFVPAMMRERAAWHTGNAAAGRGDRSLFQRLAQDTSEGPERAQRIGQAAIAAVPPVSETEADAMWTRALPSGEWPRRLRITAVNAETGLARGWSPADGVSVAVAVACSTAAPGVAPPVSVAGVAWVDGGVRSGTNADLAVDPGWHDGRTLEPGRVLVVAPMVSADLAREEAALAERGHRVRVITADPFYEKPHDLLDPRFVDVGAEAGARQADGLAEDLLKWWNEPI